MVVVDSWGLGRPGGRVIGLQQPAFGPVEGGAVGLCREPNLAIGVDTGGTFTDIFASDGTVRKLPSTPSDPVTAIVDGLGLVGAGPDSAVAHGTTVATNAVLERKGARTVLLTTSGFEDVLEIRRQTRPSIYDLSARWPTPLVSSERRLGVPERLDFGGHVLRSLTREAAQALAAEVKARSAEVVAVSLLFSYVNPEHELRLSEALRELLGCDFPISLSHEVAPQYGEFERTSTTVVNAYVMPTMRNYLHALERAVADLGVTDFHVMNSNGGLVRADVAAERPVQTVLSGPAAGVVGAQAVAAQSGRRRIITFDMGGTSTDVAVVPGEVLEGGEGEVSSFPLLVPMLTIETVGAGGGSIARVDAGGALHVGPESAGAEPGPAAYGRGRQPTVTDANLVLGRLTPSGLLGGDVPLDSGRARSALERIALALDMSVEQAAWAVVRLANSNMESAVRTVSLQRGYDPRTFTLLCFGGAGPLHAADIATGLGIDEVLVPPHPGVLAALGLTVPDLQRDYVRTVLTPLDADALPRLGVAFLALEERARQDLGDEASFGEPVMTRTVDARYLGQSFELRVPYADESDLLRSRFEERYQERYGMTGISGPIEIVNIRLRATLPRRARPQLVPPWPEPSRPVSFRSIWFGSSLVVAGLEPVTTVVAWRPSLPVGTVIPGPALLEQYDSTTLVPPGWTARVDEFFDLVLKVTRS
jgi:N-methylhydantoinase A